MLKPIIQIISIILFSQGINLFSGEGKTTAGFLKIFYPAREAALGGAYSASGNESSAIFSNPALLTEARDREVSLGFANYLQSSNIGFLSFKTSSSNTDIGAGIIGLKIDSIQRRTQDTGGVVPSEGSFDSKDMAFLLSGGWKNFLSDLIDNLNFGATLKFISSKIDNSSAYSLATDVGLLYKESEKLNISFAILNLGTKMKYENESDNIPLNLKAGASYNIQKRLNISSEINTFLYDSKFYVSIGAEYFIKDSFVLRAGYRSGYDRSHLGSIVGFSSGFAIITKDVGFNYAYTPFGDLGDVNRFDISIRF